jgi:hypothetical protein
MRYLPGSLLIIVGSFSYAQKFSFSADAQLAIPQGDYKDENPDAGVGLRMNLLYRPSVLTPIKVGLELGIQEKGRATEYFSGFLFGYCDDFKVTATNNIFSLIALTRLQSSAPKKIKPFLGITAGWNVFFSTVQVERLTCYSDYNPSYSNSSKAHWALAYGAAGGIDFPLSRFDDIGLELKVAYLFGAETRYLTDPFIDANSNVSFEERDSRTAMIIPQAGIRVRIR